VRSAFPVPYLRRSRHARAHRLYKAHVLKGLIAATVSRGYVFQMEIIVRAKAAGHSVAEVPISFVDRLYGESKLGGDEVVAYAKGIWQLVRTV
jgi:dolichol-phosphate mannosyltransferase